MILSRQSWSLGTWRRMGLLALLALPAGVVGPAPADEKPAPPPDRQAQTAAAAVGHLCTQRPEGVIAAAFVAGRADGNVVGPAEFINLDLPVQGAIAATSMVGIRDGRVAIALLRHGANNGVFLVHEASIARKVREAKIDKQMLVGIEDDRRIPTYKENPDEYNSYMYLVAHAHDVPLDALKQAALPELTYVHLLEQPGRYRGDIVHIAGFVKQLRKFDAPRGVWNDGIKVMYECLIASKEYYAHKFYVLLTEVPPGMKLGDNLDYPVTCDAYYFKRYFLENPKDGTRWRAPLLIGRGVVPVNTTEILPPIDPWLGSPIGLVLISLLVLTVVFGLFFILMRRGDVAVRSRLSGARPVEWVDPAPAPSVHLPPSEQKPSN